MSSYALAGMLGPGKAEELRRFATDLMGTGKTDHEDYLHRYHLTKEYGWIQATPMGDMYVLYFDALTDFMDENRAFAASAHPYDAWFRQAAGGILGTDFGEPLPKEFVEQLYESKDPMLTCEVLPLAFAALVQPGKSDVLRQMAGELAGPQMVNTQDYHRRYQIGAEKWFLEHTPQGDLWLYYIEAKDPGNLFQAFARSQHPYDVWTKQMLLDVTGVDYSNFTGPLPQWVLRSEAPAAVAAVR